MEQFFCSALEKLHSVKIYGVIDRDTLNCFGAFLSIKEAIRKGYAYAEWTPNYGFQVVEWDSDAPVTWGYENIKFVSVKQ